jgi:hypothetical protein
MVFKHQHFHETPPEVEAEFPPSATLEGAVSDALASAGGIDASDVAVIARGSEVTQKGTALVVVGRRGHHGDVHTPDTVDLVLVDLVEHDCSVRPKV